MILHGKGHPTVDLEISSCCAYPQYTYQVYGTRGGVMLVMLSTGPADYQFSAHDGDLDWISAGHFVHSIAQLERHAQPAPKYSSAVCAHGAAHSLGIVGPCVATIVRPAQQEQRRLVCYDHCVGNQRIAAFRDQPIQILSCQMNWFLICGCQIMTGLGIELKTVMRAALEIVCACGQSAPRPQPFLDAAVVAVIIQIKRIQIAIGVVTHNNVVSK